MRLAVFIESPCQGHRLSRGNGFPGIYPELLVVTIMGNITVPMVNTHGQSRLYIFTGKKYGTTFRSYDIRILFRAQVQPVGVGAAAV